MKTNESVVNHLRRAAAEIGREISGAACYARYLDEAGQRDTAWAVLHLTTALDRLNELLGRLAELAETQ